MARLEASHYVALAREVGGLADARVRAVHQQGEHRLRLVLEGARGRREGPLDLVLDLDPDFPRAWLEAHQVAPGAPTALAHVLRNLVQGARLEGARTVAGERVLALDLTLGGLARTLWYEGFGRQANLYVVDEAGVVRATVRGEVAKARNASVGARFAAVPPREEAGGAVPLPEAGVAETGASEAIRALGADDAVARELARRRKDLDRWLTTSRDKARGALEALAAQEARAATAPEMRRKGELLRASFHLLREGQTHVTVPDHGVEPPVDVTFDLDASRTPGEQVAACFRAAEKAERAGEEAALRRPGTLDALRRAEALLARLAEATDLERLAALESEAGRSGARPAPRAPQAPALPWRTFLSQDGWRILVGKDAAGNDRLTTREAAPGDLFLHVRGASGSHVIVPTPKGHPVPPETVRDAAELACVYSSRPKAEHNEVDVAERRHVRKRKGAPAGEVEVDRARTLRVRRDDARRERLRDAKP